MFFMANRRSYKTGVKQGFDKALYKAWLSSFINHALVAYFISKGWISIFVYVLSWFGGGPMKTGVEQGFDKASHEAWLVLFKTMLWFFLNHALVTYFLRGWISIFVYVFLWWDWVLIKTGVIKNLYKDFFSRLLLFFYEGVKYEEFKASKTIINTL